MCDCPLFRDSFGLLGWLKKWQKLTAEWHHANPQCCEMQDMETRSKDPSDKGTSLSLYSVSLALCSPAPTCRRTLWGVDTVAREVTASVMSTPFLGAFVPGVSSRFLRRRRQQLYLLQPFHFYPLITQVKMCFLFPSYICRAITGVSGMGEVLASGYYYV